MLAKDFYSIISSDESTTNFLISKNLVANNENAECNKCGSAMNLYLRKVVRREVRKGEFYVVRERDVKQHKPEGKIMLFGLILTRMVSK
ncbi:unnamed protein product [Macrosiphum euphorbiae]|uniref:Uncharacterized protein n=1 Tax=Macrosiphum euphorbiae TaxID=13131 RepID=A0AAV0WX55_9HEMI|nr:unnamed protein product [Macrosiphum euphorbiae]